MRKLSIVAVLSLLGLHSCKAGENLPVQAFQDRLSTDGAAQLLDVRTAAEFAAGHLPGAINIDWQADGFLPAVQAALDPSRPVLLYCRSGRRSAAAATELAKAGFSPFNLLGGILAWQEAGLPVTTYEVERFCTPSGAPLEIWLIKHGSLAIAYKGLSIQVDPVAGYGKPTDYAADFPKAHYVLVTHEHGDHFDPEVLSFLGGQVITNARCAQMLGRGSVLVNGEGMDICEGIHVDAVPAYNTTEGHLQFHPQGRDNGYILSVDGFRIYIAGDTEDIPEMAAIKDIDVAFLPCNQPYTMTVPQCIAAARMVKPKVLIPYHFGQTDISGIPAALPEIDVRLRQMQ